MGIVSFLFGSLVTGVILFFKKFFESNRSRESRTNIFAMGEELRQTQQRLHQQRQQEVKAIRTQILADLRPWTQSLADKLQHNLNNSKEPQGVIIRQTCREWLEDLEDSLNDGLS